ncbi:TraB/GumN family protein [Pantoea sp.]|uniref:TraB/GumN family protein n=1 Tax=Pantoea sp. TaxID=69393 RepID=UPI0028A180EE|nr:TraB/GumN family protein [Pantoea sp.]
MMRSFRQMINGILRRLMPASYAWPAVDIRLGDRQLHLVGSIHMGTQDMQPLPPKLLRLLQQADSLIVEADITTGASPFVQTDEQPPLAERLDRAELAQLRKLCDELNLSIELFDTLPAWQIALMLQAQQAQQLGLRPDYGIDYQLLMAAKRWRKPVRELEGPEVQLALLKGLPNEGLALLLDTLTHWHTNARLLQTMISWWLDAPQQQQPTSLPSTFSNVLNDMLMSQRNLRWRDTLSQLPAGRYVVAVGALHLYGKDNLPELLRRA